MCRYDGLWERKLIENTPLLHGPYNGFSLESAESAEVGPRLVHAQFACVPALGRAAVLKLLSLLSVLVLALPQGPLQQQNTSFDPTHHHHHASFTPGSKGLASLVARHCYILSAHCLNSVSLSHNDLVLKQP